MTNTSAPVWEAKRTDETRNVEDLLRQDGFDRVDAYRYNLASIRVRVIDRRFEGLPVWERDTMIEPLLAQLPEQTQADIMTRFTFAPDELGQPLNMEFENPSPSML